MVIAHLVYDTRSLLACSLTSRFWYIAAVRHLHNTLITHTRGSIGDQKNEWPNPLLVASELGFLPSVTRLSICGGSSTSEEFSTRQFRRRTRRVFSILTNVRELSISFLDIPNFMPKIRKYFGQFSPTLRSLTLINPRGSYRQILFFVGLFPHLEDLGLHAGGSDLQGKANDLTLIPFSVPPLQGRLTARLCGGEDLASTMSDLFGGVRFHHMDLSQVWGTQDLLDACADTLETLRLDASDNRERLSSDDRRAPAHALQSDPIWLSICPETGLFRCLKSPPGPSLGR